LHFLAGTENGDRAVFDRDQRGDGAWNGLEASRVARVRERRAPLVVEHGSAPLA
jgi:hypothetical protein